AAIRIRNGCVVRSGNRRSCDRRRRSDESEAKEKDTCRQDQVQRAGDVEGFSESKLLDQQKGWDERTQDRTQNVCAIEVAEGSVRKAPRGASYRRHGEGECGTHCGAPR